LGKEEQPPTLKYKIKKGNEGQGKEKKRLKKRSKEPGVSKHPPTFEKKGHLKKEKHWKD